LVEIILEIRKEGILKVDLDSIPENDNPLNKTTKELIINDYKAGKDLTGHAKYRGIYEAEGAFNGLQLAEWRSKVKNIAELPKPNLAER